MPETTLFWIGCFVAFLCFAFAFLTVNESRRT